MTSAATPSSIEKRLLLATELGVLFFLGPSIYTLAGLGQGWLFPMIWLLAAYAVTMLLLDRTFPRHELWNMAALRRVVRLVTARFLVLAVGMMLAVMAADRWYFEHPVLFSLAKRNPALLGMIMVLYPLLSVLPQELAFRTFFFHRYRPLLPGRAWMIGVSAAAFSWAHIVFQNGLALVLCLVAGLLFGHTYWKSRSTAAAWFEHALYGCFIFAVGLGQYFYAGAVGRD
ncbi:MAG: CPBP family intramembrane metalloprotease [Phycisphaeraceae bacterium]|nr:CPBP family intramembrane metalloprotease [Phycisphaeraceae bacterium]